ncbi:sigma-E factor negative regulatory protein RseA [Marinobacter salarius]|jgi:sigma-E factor negative regulatory protein RseA|uniref:Sigma-E factor negative regulatory protein RseA n=2 Tax=Marinobacter TaxID=2742 RepID=A0ABY1FLN0_9GAMM|nr:MULTISPECIES: sigma-E factor negative regulatory protein [Marinobacter]KXJ48708.1 MAG: anti-sigma factor [Marinobacter sp. Hex_13]MBS8229750.1 anti-sigma factor [Marinobacter salarius]SFL58079.1 sigma-E factor negative regulatory protein RseA [Marinobacter salarius]
MDDRLKETLSAMMDDEADELSVRRLLSHAEQDQVRSQWQRWQQVRDLMHQGSVAPEAVDVSAGVRDVLDGSGAVSPAATVGSMPRRDKSWHWPAVAMVTLAAVIGFGAGAGWESAEDGGAITAAGVSEEQDRQESAVEPVPEVALQGLDEEQWEHLSRYLLEHAQHNSVGAGRGSVGYARVVSASGPGY